MVRRNQFTWSLLAMAVMVLAAGPALAQAPPGPVTPKPGAPVQQPPVPQPEKQIRVKVELVSTPVSVRDTSGELVYDLERRDFRIFDDGVEQKIENFDHGGEPISAVLVFESSSRIEPMLPAVRRTGILFTQNILGETGEAAVVSYDDEVNLLLPFSADHDRIEKAVTGLRMGTSGARLHDALSRAVQLLRDRAGPEASGRRPIIIAIAEATDTGSESNFGEVLREAQLAGVTIYSVGLSTTAAMLRSEPRPSAPISPTPPGTFGRPPIPGTPQTPTSEQQRGGQIDLLAAIIWAVSTAAHGVGSNVLTLATEGTGGAHVPTFRDRSIERAIDEVGAEIHAQYTLTYRPRGTHASGFHEIKVEVRRRGMTARARPGYYLGPEEK